jgi:putative inorganic carbon (HCO3(-)) transporter
MSQLEFAVLLVATPFLLFPSRLTVLALLLLVAPWLVRWRFIGRPTASTPMDVPILCLLLMVPVAVWVSPLPQESLRKLLGIILGVCFFYGLVNSTHTRGWLWCWTLLLVGAGVAIAFLSLFGTDWADYKSLPLQPIYQQLPRLFHNITAYGEGGFHPNEVGGALTLVLPPTLAVCLVLLGDKAGWLMAASGASARDAQADKKLGWSRRTWLRRGLLPLLIVSFTLTAIAFLLTQSRSAYLGLSVGLVVFGISRSRWFLVALLVLSLVTLGVGLHLGLEDSVEALVQAQSARLGVGRFEIWERAVSLLQDFPYTGIGLNTFPQVSETMYPYPARSPAGLVPHAHNNLLQVGTDLGIPGLVAYVGVLAAFTGCTWWVHKQSESRPMRLLAWGVFAGMVAHQVYGLTDAITLGAKPGFLLWMMWGLMAALWRLEASRHLAPGVQAGSQA